MLKIDISSLQPHIDALVKQYYELPEKPILHEMAKDKTWIKDMIARQVEFAVVNLELGTMQRVEVDESAPRELDATCVRNKGYTIVRKLGDYSTKFLLKGGKAAKIQWIYLWEYRQKEELKSKMANEFRIYKKAEKLGIGPKTYDVFLCRNTDAQRFGKVVISEYIPGLSLAEWLQNEPSKAERDAVLQLVKAKIETMHTHGIIHNRLDSTNIILKISRKKVVDAYITDFLQAFDVRDRKMWEYNRWIQGDRAVLDTIQNKVTSFSHTEDVIHYVAHRLLEDKFIRLA